MYPFQNQQQQHVPLPPSQHQHYQVRYPQTGSMLPPNHAAAAAAAATMGQPPPFQPPPGSGQTHPHQQQQGPHMYQYMPAPHPSSFPPHPSGMYFASPSSLQHPQVPPPHHSTGQNGLVSSGHPAVIVAGANIHPGIKSSHRESIDKLIMQISNPKQQITNELIYERRLFFEKLVLLNEQHGETLSGPPQVSKSPVDLYSLYYAVKQRGGFEKTIRDKIWKNLCCDANTEMQQSSAAGFQLRKHYQKYLLKLECLETGQNIKELVEFAEKQKKKKKEKDVLISTSATPIPPTAGGGPGTPSSSTSSSIVGKDDKIDLQQQQQRPSPFGGGNVSSSSSVYPPQGYSFHPSPAPQPGSDFGPSPVPPGYPPPPPQHFVGGQQQYPPSQQQQQWAAYQQQIYLQQRMRGPPQQPSPTNPSSVSGKQQAEDEHQQQQQLQGGRINSSGSSSRLSSTPAPADQQQNRSSSAAIDYQSNEKRIDENIDNSGENCQKDVKNNSAASFPPIIQMGNSIPSSSNAYYQQQHQIPHPTLYAPRYSPGSLPSSSDYGHPAVAMYGGNAVNRTPQQQQQQIWSPYGGMQNAAAVAAAVRYHHQQQQPPPNIGPPLNRYPPPHPYSQQSTSHNQPPNGVAINSPQLLAASVSQQQQQQSNIKHHSKGRNQGLLPLAPSVPVAAYPQQPPQQFPAWFGSATMSTQQSPFVPYSLEAQAIAHVQHQQQQVQLQQQRYRRPKVYARDLQGVTPTRIVMALRSALHLETCWALNALNIQLYDDTTPNSYPSLSQTPEFLNLLVEHFAAVLSLLFPKNFDVKMLKIFSSKSTTQSTSKNKQLIKNKNNNKLKIVEPVSLMVRPPPLYPSPSTSFSAANIIGNNNNNNSTISPNFTLISRLGRQVKLDMTTTEIPLELALQMEMIENEEDNEDNVDEEEKELEEENSNNWSTLFIERIGQSMLDYINSRQSMSKFASRFSQYTKIEEDNDDKNIKIEEKENIIIKKEDNIIKKEVEDVQKNEEIDNETNSKKSPFFYRKALLYENWDRYSMDEVLLISRQSVLCNSRSITSSSCSSSLKNELIERCLSISNIFRGFSFLGETKILSQHGGLLRLLAGILMLYCNEESRKRVPGNAPRQFSFPRPPPEEDLIKNESSDINKINNVVSSSSSSSTFSSVPAEQDNQDKWLLEVANQLRDDAFTILSHISPQLDLYEIDSEISFSLFDALLHWSVCTDLSARDPLPPYGAVSPKHLVLETFCKMSVLEKNIDLLLSTGPWPRIEEFVKQLCSLICEEPPIREFSIFILNSICSANEPICHVITNETQLLDHLVSFLEAADASMTQIAQQHGIHALRENPEIIGTSVGMLRRATLIMTHIVKYIKCRKYFKRLQHRLLQFTVSHFMDSRVAAMVADILYEMQKGGDEEENNDNNNINNNEEEYSINKKIEKYYNDLIKQQKCSSPKLNGNSEEQIDLNSKQICLNETSLINPPTSTSLISSQQQHSQQHSTSTTALLALYNGGTTENNNNNNVYSNTTTSTIIENNKNNNIKLIQTQHQQQQQLNGCYEQTLYWYNKNENTNNTNNNDNTTTTLNNEQQQTSNKIITPKKRGRKRPNVSNDVSVSPNKKSQKKQQLNKKHSENTTNNTTADEINSSVKINF